MISAGIEHAPHLIYIWNILDVSWKQPHIQVFADFFNIFSAFSAKILFIP